MGYELKRVGQFIDSEIDKTRKLYLGELQKKEAAESNEEDFDDSEFIKYAHYMQILTHINRALFYPSEFERFDIIQEVLMRNNRDENITEIVFLDDNVLTINYDMLVDFRDGFLVVYNKEYYEEKGPGIIPPVDSLINLANVKEIHTIYNDGED